MTQAQDLYWFAYSQNGPWNGEYPSREAAFAEASAGRAGRDVFTARGVPWRPPLGNLGGDVVEALSRLASDEFEDECVEGWPEPDKADLARLDAVLEAVVGKWMDDTGNWPQWSEMVEIQRHPATDPPTDPADDETLRTLPAEPCGGDSPEYHL